MKRAACACFYFFTHTLVLVPFFYKLKMWYRYKVQVQVQDVLELATLTCVEGRRHSFGAGGAFLTKNGKKGERKGRFLRARVAESSLFPFVIRQVCMQVQVNDPVIVALWNIKHKTKTFHNTSYLYLVHHLCNSIQIDYLEFKPSDSNQINPSDSNQIEGVSKTIS